MENTDARIKEAQARVNRCRNEITIPGRNEYRNVKGFRKPGDKGYLPPAEFVTIEFTNGFITVEAEYFNRLPKCKKNKLTKP